ncbi:Harbinger transposase-derived nuclease [Gossypium australe]|uniref:Harbinger transposase-derived nuclease n=1 Tax=Gossypium australe TaxID=47621 RepID=A0A5B6UJW8_9ROSI|nr:Harbinger transposase-derived nuclease [Gossypium australe]
MGPARGLKKRRKIEKKPEENASASSEKERSIDWWDELSRKMNVANPRNGLLLPAIDILLLPYICFAFFGCLFTAASTRILSKLNAPSNSCLQSPSKGSDKFKSVFKISRKTFNYICSLVKEDMMAKPGSFTFSNGKPVSFEDQVAVALRRLSSGESLVIVGDLFGLHHSTVSQLTWRFVEAMEERGLHHLRWPSTEEEMMEIKSKFEKIQGLPNCCGVIDTTHIMMCLPSSDPASKVWLDHEKNHSMVLQAIVDPEMRFRDIVTGWPGKIDDWLVFQSSNFYELCDKGERLNGKNFMLPEGSEIREYIIGDVGYPLLPYLIIPYEGKELPELRAEFNKRHSATRLVAHRALARLKEMWKIIQGVMWRPDKHKLPRIILVCCLLHNIVIDLEDDVQDEMPLSHDHDSGYRQRVCGSVDIKGVHLRDKLSVYLSGKSPLIVTPISDS